MHLHRALLASAIAFLVLGFACGLERSLGNDANPVDGGFEGSRPTIEARSGEICSLDRWCWESPRPQGNMLSGVWGSGPTDVWAVGEVGTLLHWDGASWRGSTGNLQVGLRRDLHDVWGSGPADVWAVGNDGTILHGDGTRWMLVPSPTPQRLLGVWGSGPNDVWAVGDEGTIIHFDGASWTTVPAGTTAHLTGVWASSANDVWAIGREGLVLHFDGSAWSTATDLKVSSTRSEERPQTTSG